MSFDALAWAAKRKPGNLAAKMVLLALANFADEHGCAYPSTAALADFGDMDHKTATAALDRLTALGLIEDSGERAGRTKQIKVYRLRMESQPKAEGFQKRKASVSSAKDPQKRGTDTVKEPKVSGAKAPSPKRVKFPAPDGVTDGQWKAFQAQRKKPLNDHSYMLLTNKLSGFADEGHPPGDLIDLAIERGWETVFKPYSPKDRSNGQPAQSDLRPRSRLLDALNAADDAIAQSALPEDHAGAWLALPTAGTG